MTLRTEIKRFLSFKMRKISAGIKRKKNTSRHKLIFKRFSDYTMIPKDEYLRNLALAEKTVNTKGTIVECGVWRGGMIAGIAAIHGKDREYYLFDSFEGLPEVKGIDGKDALEWQSDTTSPYYFDNCKAEIGFAQQAMLKALGSDEHTHFIKGWFIETLNEGNFDAPISLLRLDGDWYDSTMACLEYLFPKVVPGGMIIIDDYYTWEGCAKAVHDYLSRNARSERICQFNNRTAYIIKI